MLKINHSEKFEQFQKRQNLTENLRNLFSLKRSQATTVMTYAIENLLHFLESFKDNKILLGADILEIQECINLNAESKCVPRLFNDYFKQKHRQLLSFSSSLDIIISYFENAWKRCMHVVNQERCEILIVSQLELASNLH